MNAIRLQAKRKIVNIRDDCVFLCVVFFSFVSFFYIPQLPGLQCQNIVCILYDVKHLRSKTIDYYEAVILRAIIIIDFNRNIEMSSFTTRTNCTNPINHSNDIQFSLILLVLYPNMIRKQWNKIYRKNIR